MTILQCVRLERERLAVLVWSIVLAVTQRLGAVLWIYQNELKKVDITCRTTITMMQDKSRDASASVSDLIKITVSIFEYFISVVTQKEYRPSRSNQCWDRRETYPSIVSCLQHCQKLSAHSQSLALQLDEGATRSWCGSERSPNRSH